jgi:hypothetical protein
MMPFSVSFWRGESLVFRVDVEADDEISAVATRTWTQMGRSTMPVRSIR